jgi:sugar/nucleoside kinase (ribokinase family)
VEVPHLDRPGDDIGAGDVFAAAFFIALAEGRPPALAADFANAAAAVRMSGAGARAIGDRAAIEARLQAVA